MAASRRDRLKKLVVVQEQLKALHETRHAGFVAKALVLAPQMQGKGRWVDMPEQSHQPIVQNMALLKPAAANPDARKLFDYLSSPAARAILQRYGYRLP